MNLDILFSQGSGDKLVNAFLFKEESKNEKGSKPSNPLGISRDSLDGEIFFRSEKQETQCRKKH